MVSAINVLDATGATVSVATNDAVKASVDAGNALLTTQATYLDGLETLTGATNTALAGTLGVNQITAARGSTATITRPANVTPYVAGAVIGGALTLAGQAPTGGAVVMITGSRFELDIAALPSGAANFRLYLYSSTPPSALAEGAVWDLPAGDRNVFLGYVDLGTPVDLGSTLYVQQDSLSHQCGATGADLFAYLVTIGGYIPAANSEVYRLRVHNVTV